MTLFKALYTLLKSKDNKYIRLVDFREEFRDLIEYWHASGFTDFIDMLDRAISRIHGACMHGPATLSKQDRQVLKALIVVRKYYWEGDKVFVNRY